MIVGNSAEVAELVVVDIHRETLFYGLLDEVVHYCIRLTAARRTKNYCGTERIDNVNPTFVPLLLVVETCWQIDGILVLQETGFLHEGFVLVVEHIIHEIVLE